MTVNLFCESLDNVHDVHFNEEAVYIYTRSSEAEITFGHLGGGWGDPACKCFSFLQNKLVTSIWELTYDIY
jgi:hypothetical protein